MTPLPPVLNTPSQEKWQKIGRDKRAGILVPLFSVYSKKSLGIADFQDLKLLVDFAQKTGNSIIQLLPMNEVGALFCPYDSLSSFALEPMYISGLKGRFPLSQPYVNYGIKKVKMELLREIYLKKGREAAEFDRFQQENSYWLGDFALFKALKDFHQGRPWYEWEGRYKNRDRAALEAFKKEHTPEIDFQVWLQWLAFRQFKEARAYAESKKVLLKGDLPILVSRDSSDAWAHPEFFKLEFAAGAPPDMYTALGQRWGMPTYNWEKIAQDNYRYLKEKLRYAENFYDILRIDHVVGLFRIWSIPYNEPREEQGLNGFFDPQDETKWEEQGRKILAVILQSTKMLICAEDLGVIPAACPKALEEFGIPGNEVQRWVKDWKIKHDFLAPKDYRWLSVAMLSTHDTTNWPAWWENEAGTVDEGLFLRRCNERGIDYSRVKQELFDPQLSRHGRLRWREEINSVDKLMEVLSQGLSPQLVPEGEGTVPKEMAADFIEFYENSYQEKEKLWKHLGLKGPMREKCHPEIIRAALKITLEARSIFCINSMIDWLFLAGLLKGEAYQYRINTPATISEKNWSLRIPLSLEDLLKHKVCKEIEKMTLSLRGN